MAAHLDLAARDGADLRFDEPVISWDATGDGVRVRTADGAYTAGRLVICPGAWAPTLLADLGVPFSVERQVQYWFAPPGGVGPFAGAPDLRREEAGGARSTASRPSTARTAASRSRSSAAARVTPDALDRVVTTTRSPRCAPAWPTPSPGWSGRS